MKKFIASIGAASILAGAAAANEPAPDPRTVIQSANAIDYQNPANPVGGGGILYRNVQGIDANVAYDDLAPNAAYSAWWAIFNRPDRCAGPCDDPDIVAGIGQVFYAGGFLTGADGRANVTLSLAKGRTPVGAQRFSSVLPIIDPASEVGLRRPMRAQIAIVARNHGPIIDGGTAAQISAYFGGCAGHGGAFACADEQIVVFPGR